MRALLVSLLLLLSTSSAYAEVVRVRTADLGSVTRLLLEFSARPNWRLEKSLNTYEISLDGTTRIELDKGPNFPDRVLSRLSSIEVGESGNSIIVNLSCQCWARIYQFQEQSLVVDIENGIPSERTLFKSASTPERLNTTSWHQEDYSRLPPPAAPEDLNLRFPSRAIDNLPKQDVPQMLSPVQPKDSPSGQNTKIDILDLLGAERPEVPFQVPRTRSDQTAVKALSRELSRAVSQGLVEAPVVEVPPRESLGVQGEVQTLAEGQSNIMITTSVDRDIALSRDRLDPTHIGSVCHPDEAFEIEAWGDPSERRLIGALRSKLFDEDGPSEQGAIDLANYYIAIGFGAEAAAISDLIQDTQKRELLRSMSEIVDYGQTDSAIFDGQIGCSGRVALWALLAGPVSVFEKPNDTKHILSAFSKLPQHMRVHLGPFLSERLQALGFTTDAQVALNAVTRGGGNTPAQNLTSARLGLNGTDVDSAREVLEDLSRGTDVISAQALLELLLDAENRGVPPNPKWVAEAPSLVRATQGTETAKSLNLAALRGQISLGQFDSFRNALSQQSPALDEHTRMVLASRALGAAGRVADMPTLLRTELAFSSIVAIERISEEERIILATRLVGLGLPNRALSYLHDDPKNPDEILIKSRALAEVQRVDEAISILNGGTSEAFLSRVAVLLERKDRIPEALAAYVQAAELDTASTTAIREADWAWVEEFADPDLAAATAGLRAAVEPVPLDPPIGNAFLLSQSISRREYANILLSRTPITAEADPFTN